MISLVLNTLKEFENLESYEHYRKQEKLIEEIFQENSKNDNEKSILLKVCVLDSFYSTNLRMRGIYEVSKHILSLNIDKDLKEKNINVIEKIANFKDTKGKQCFLYSFASKYCFHHDKENYVIYDKFVQKSLIHFFAEERFCDFEITGETLKKYENLIKAIESFRSFYKLDDFNNRQIDHFLWFYGKDEEERNKRNKNKQKA
ncbi:hypothetical protein [Campylobacter sp. W0014]|uniref:hypothetical protein n=1 Tax=Campylobacter sp. W0014 TaxID=2735781 RepID=UPI00301D79B4